MNERNAAVLNIQITLSSVLTQLWNISYSKLSDIFRKYDVLEYIGVSYEHFNSMGNQGIADDIREYVEMQGGSIQ